MGVRLKNGEFLKSKLFNGVDWVKMWEEKENAQIGANKHVGATVIPLRITWEAR